MPGSFDNFDKAKEVVADHTPDLHAVATAAKQAAKDTDKGTAVIEVLGALGHGAILTLGEAIAYGDPIAGDSFHTMIEYAQLYSETFQPTVTGVIESIKGEVASATGSIAKLGPPIKDAFVKFWQDEGPGPGIQARYAAATAAAEQEGHGRSGPGDE